MKKFLLTIISIGLLAACSGGDSESVPTCSAVTAINVVQRAGDIDFSVTTTGGIYTEISIVPVVSGNTNPDYGNLITLESASKSFKILGDINTSGQVLLYARSVCDGNVKGPWFGPKPFTIADYCETPRDLNVSYGQFTWRYDSPLNNIAASTYQVEYGIQGFTVGTGTKITVNNPMCTTFSLLAGNNYDFYVRAYCVNNVGYGNYAGPYTYYAESSYNACQPPTNITYTSTSNGATTRNTQLIWSGNGESRFEHVCVVRGNSISNGTIHLSYNNQAAYNLSIYNDYDFYVRPVCGNGNTTAWVKREIDF
ncbi:hypothetical protein GR160_14480 [Flavobacterium sp. Sd200]|uniref:hypothetical protein n=1 Tax=Flavobacterium sp. Sd200 TaxID=2692211 RepID=UPI00136BABC7|nr:hypothetical protein [Flavobacterium sp. Sd200]MXN92432.1 hypothetical protein [Flavobacterium sp. Sd200]